MQEDSVNTNYNSAGTAVMEMIYGDDFLSPGGLVTTKALVELAKMSNGLRVLDIGSGLGGAGFYLAQSKRCQVTGVDLVQENVAEASRRAIAKRLADRTRFVLGDAQYIPFEDRQFEVVWGQDAWCHVDNKQQLIEEAHRVLTSDGLIVFSDWLLTNTQDSSADNIRQVTASPNMADVETYQALLAASGFERIAFVDASGALTKHYRDVLARLDDVEAEVCRRFSRKVFNIIRSKQQVVLNSFATGVLGAGHFVACKPAAA